MSQKRQDKLDDVKALLDILYTDVSDILYIGIESTPDADSLQKSAAELIAEVLKRYENNYKKPGQ